MLPEVAELTSAHVSAKKLDLAGAYARGSAAAAHSCTALM